MRALTCSLYCYLLLIMLHGSHEFADTVYQTCRMDTGKTSPPCPVQRFKLQRPPERLMIRVQLKPPAKQSGPLLHCSACLPALSAAISCSIHMKKLSEILVQAGFTPALVQKRGEGRIRCFDLSTKTPPVTCVPLHHHGLWIQTDGPW